MGNRAIITAAPARAGNVGIYVHWNGGQESIEGFAKAAEQLLIRDPSEDPVYAMAQLTRLIGNFFGGTLSLGIGKVSELDPGDNGIWALGKGWRLEQARCRYAARVEKLSPEDREKRDSIAAACVESFERG